ncbi:MAG: PAS domain S-box protein, partial [Rhodospirillales bacterium]|nr:PAS domain S-box protein [Rhodospirillales bacterium]
MPASPPLRIALAYALFGALWVAVSDHVAGWLTAGPVALTILQTWKGWLFVAVSAALILALASRNMRALAASEARYRVLYEDSPQPMVLYDPATRLMVDINPAAESLFGYSRGDLTGRSVIDLVPEAMRAEFGILADSIQAEGGDRETVVPIQRRDGSMMTLAMCGRGVSVAGRPLRMVLAHDISARVAAEKELHLANDRLARSNEELCALAHAAAHDLQEPVR